MARRARSSIHKPVENSLRRQFSHRPSTLPVPCACAFPCSSSHCSSLPLPCTLPLFLTLAFVLVPQPTFGQQAQTELLVLREISCWEGACATHGPYGPLSQWLSLPFGYTGRYLVVGVRKFLGLLGALFPSSILFSSFRSSERKRNGTALTLTKKLLNNSSPSDPPCCNPHTH